MKRSLVIILLLCMILTAVSCTAGGSVSEDAVSSAESAVPQPEISATTPEASEEASEEISSEVSKEVSEEISAEVSHEVSEEVSAEVSSEVSDDVPAVPSFKPCPAKVHIYITEDRVHKSYYIPCRIIIEDPSGKYETIDADNATIKIRGNSTSSGAKKPYNVKFSSKENVLGMGKCKKWYLLANMYDKSLMRNKLAYDFASDIGMAYTQQSTFADVYLNDKYIGNYQICESIGVGESRVDIDTEGNEFLLEYEPYPNYANPNYIYTPCCGILFGFNDPETPSEEQLEWLKKFLQKAELALLSGELDEVRKYWDVESFVDDYIVHEYFKCVDAQTSSTRFYIEDGRICGGPVWDFDLSSGNANPDYYTTYQDKAGDSTVGWWCNRGIWYPYFFETDWFLDMVKARFAELQPIIVNLYRDNELGKNKIDLLQEYYGSSFKSNFAPGVWKVSSKDSEYEKYTFGTYEQNIRFLRNWLEKRNDWMRSQWGIK